MRKLLAFNPAKRLTVDEALQHKYLQQLHCPEDEPTGTPIESARMEWESRFLSEDEYRELIVNEIKHANDPAYHAKWGQKRQLPRDERSGEGAAAGLACSWRGRCGPYAEKMMTFFVPVRSHTHKIATSLLLRGIFFFISLFIINKNSKLIILVAL